MSDVVIKAEKLGKKYRIGKRHSGDLRNAFGNWIKSVRTTDKSSDSSVVSDNNFWALRDVSFEIRKGDAVGIIGRNGAGKSTLLKILSRITAPTTGKFTIDGRVSSLLEVGTGFHMELTGRENVYLNGTILGMKRSEIRKKFDEIVAFSGVEKFIDTPVKHYSSGMQVRLAFSVAAHLDAEILLIDEVLAVGDVEFQKKCLGKMEDVTGQGRTVLFVSHNMGAMKSLCSNGIILNQGSLILNGKIESVVNEYLRKVILSGNQIHQGNGIIKVLSISILDYKGTPVLSINTFDHIVFKVMCRIEQEIKNVSLAICFNNINNTRVTSLWSLYYNKSFDLRKGDYNFVFNVPKLKLIPGFYEVITYVESNGDVIERIDNFMQIVVGTPKNFDFVQIPTIDQGLYTEEFSIELASE